MRWVLLSSSLSQSLSVLVTIFTTLINLFFCQLGSVMIFKHHFSLCHTLSRPGKRLQIVSTVNLKWQQVKTAKQRFIFFSRTLVLYHCEVRCHCHVVCTSVNGQMNSWHLGSWFLVLDILIHNISALTAQNCYPTRLHYTNSTKCSFRLLGKMPLS